MNSITNSITKNKELHDEYCEPCLWKEDWKIKASIKNVRKATGVFEDEENGFEYYVCDEHYQWMVDRNIEGTLAQKIKGEEDKIHPSIISLQKKYDS